jgi:hypothetical protein
MREQGVGEEDFRILLEDQALGTHWVWLFREQGVLAA